MNKIILRRALDTYGLDSQMKMAIEEMSELIKALLKYDRSPGPKTLNDIVEEIADVEIMIAQMRIVFDNGQVEKMIEVKIDRLADRLSIS
jgi:NTP pyrophosphatase (non-canonical NTP hydrolase)